MSALREGIIAILPDIAIVLLALIAIAYKLGRLHKNLETVLEKINNQETNITAIQTAITTIDKYFHGLAPQVASNRSDITLLKNKLIPSSFADTKSPMHMTDKGKKLFTDSGLEDIIDTQRETINNEFSDYKKSSNPFDIQSYAQKIAPIVYENYTTENEKDTIKRELYQAGASILDLQTVIWIELRDRMLAETGYTSEEL